MDSTQIAILAIAAVVIVVALVWLFYMRRRRTELLKDRFGPEYERVVEGAGDRRQAEAELKERVERRDGVTVRELSAESKSRYALQWSQIQARFVEQPDHSVQLADALLVEVMREKGYPGDPSSLDLVSVDHPEVIENYREARRVADAQRDGSATTEDLRRCLVHLKTLFGRLLLDEGDGEADEVDVTDRRMGLLGTALGSKEPQDSSEERRLL